MLLHGNNVPTAALRCPGSLSGRIRCNNFCVPNLKMLNQRCSMWELATCWILTQNGISPQEKKTLQTLGNSYAYYKSFLPSCKFSIIYMFRCFLPCKKRQLHVWSASSSMPEMRRTSWQLIKKQSFTIYTKWINEYNISTVNLFFTSSINCN